jgi:hypothetical protein
MPAGDKGICSKRVNAGRPFATSAEARGPCGQRVISNQIRAAHQLFSLLVAFSRFLGFVFASAGG